MSLKNTVANSAQQLTDRGVLTTDTELRVIAWNEWLVNHTGRSVEEVLGRKLFDVFPDLVVRRLDAAYRRALDGQVIVLAQRLHAYLLKMPPSEDVQWTAQMQQSARIAPLVEDDRVVGTVTVVEDVTERVEYENELATRARQQAVIASLAQRGLSGCDLNELMAVAVEAVAETLSVDQCAVWQYAPQSGQAMLRAGVGWEPGEAGTTVPAASLEASTPVTETPFFAEHKITTTASALVSAGAEPFGCLAIYTAERRVFGDDIYQFLRTVADVISMAVDRKRLETELRDRALALAEADRRKDEFLAMLAHELRNPLAPILHAVQIIGMQRAGPEDLAAAYAILRGQVEQMARLIDDLLDVSRITHGQITLRKERLRLSDVIKQAVDSSRPLIEARGHKLQISLPVEPLDVRGDPARLVQVITNLLNNASKYTEDCGDLRLSLTRDGNEAVISMRDSGVGISAEMLPRVFDLFAQATRSLDRSQGGLGIGLTLVRRLVDLHGGSVAAHSGGLGEGSEFLVRLPLAEGPRPVAAGQPETPPAGRFRRLRVLVVDDNTDAADSLVTLLRVAGHESVAAYDGQAALDCAAQRELDVIFLDIGLPRMDGYEVARRLRGQHGDRLCLIALTGYGQADDRETSRRAGFDKHLVKPVGFAQVQQALAECYPA